MSMQPIANEEMVRNAFGDDYDELAEPPCAVVTRDHPLWPAILKGLRAVYDPEIPVNVYELGLIYTVDIRDAVDGKADVFVEMTLTSPACPVAQEMPGMVQSAIFPVDGVGNVDVEIIWEPAWDPSKMAETAKLQLNMFT
jgi:FeS assembly SUF system protein